MMFNWSGAGFEVIDLTAIRGSELSWSQALERQVAPYEQYAAAVEARLTQLMRESDRGLVPLIGPLPPVEREEQLVGQTLVCVSCRRDHRTEPGLELMTADGGMVCWACGRAGAPELAGEVLANAADHAERAALDVCKASSDFLIELIRERGFEERASQLERRVIRIQRLLRESRRRGQADPDVWRPEPWLERAR